jgi:hypothetical protein
MERLKGIVVPTEWDSFGNVISLAIATGDEQEYLIENNQQIESLRPLLRQEVVVMGSIKCCNDHKIIAVAQIHSGETINSD